MDFNEYQKKAARTGMYPKTGINPMLYCVLGLTEEAGEVAGKIKKVYRDNGGDFSEEKLAEIEKELGDVLWYLSELGASLDMNLEDIAKTNIAKLASRNTRGTLAGSGDNR